MRGSDAYLMQSQGRMLETSDVDGAGARCLLKAQSNDFLRTVIVVFGFRFHESMLEFFCSFDFHTLALLCANRLVDVLILLILVLRHL